MARDEALHTPWSSDSFTSDVAAQAHENLADFYNIVEWGFLCLIFSEKEQLYNSLHSVQRFSLGQTEQLSKAAEQKKV